MQVSRRHDISMLPLAGDIYRLLMLVMVIDIIAERNAKATSTPSLTPQLRIYY